MRNIRTPASASSLSASSPIGVRPFVGGPGDMVIGNTFRPLMAKTRSSSIVTTELVCANPLWHAATASSSIERTHVQADAGALRDFTTLVIAGITRPAYYYLRNTIGTNGPF